jgi:serine acetyltransferase
VPPHTVVAGAPAKVIRTIVSGTPDRSMPQSRKVYF